MKKVIILAIALLSTAGIVVSAMAHKSNVNIKPAVLKVVKTADKNIANDVIATAD